MGRYCFNEVVLEADSRELRVSSVAVPVEPKVFDVLLYLAQHPGRVVTRDELLDACWSGVYVSDGTLSRCLSRVRVAIGQSRTDNQPIKTLYKQGYRLCADVCVEEDEDEAPAIGNSSSAPVIAPQPTPAPEQRLVVLAYVGFRSIRQTGSDPKYVRRRVLQLIADSAGLIERHGGGAATVSGDHVTIQFGYPEATERTAEAAVSCALALGERARNLDIDARFGIAAGWAILQWQRHGAFVLNQEPNRAAELLARAGEGEIIVDDRTVVLVQNAFQAHPIADAENVFSISARPDRQHNPIDLPFVNRDSQLLHLEQRWNQATSGHGRVVLVQGEPGVGKTTLVEEFLRRANISEDVVFRSNCSWSKSMKPFAPLLEIVRRNAKIDANTTPIRQFALLEAALKKAGRPNKEHLPLFASMLSVHAAQYALEELHLDEGLMREGTMTALLSLLLPPPDTARILWLEDLHWADPLTLHTLARLAHAGQQQKLLIILSNRADPPPELKSYDQITVKPFDRRQVMFFLEQCSNHGMLTNAQIETVVERSDGVPLFLSEFVRAAPDGIDDTIPDTLRDLLQVRVNAAGEFTPTLKWASVIGRRFDTGILEAVAPGATDGGALETLVNEGLIEPVARSSEFVFSHALVRDAAYESMTPKERRTKHGRIADALIDLFPDRTETEPDVVAYHLEASGALHEATAYWKMAVKAAASFGSKDEARQQYRAALDAAQQVGSRAEGADLVSRIDDMLESLAWRRLPSL